MSPGFEVNDLGYAFRTDVVNMHVGAGYQWTEPGRVFRRADVGIAAFQSYDFGGTSIWRGIFHFAKLTFHNFWQLRWNYAYNPWTYDNRRTRGGPLVHMPPGWEFGVEVNTDSRKEIEVFLGVFTYMRTNEPAQFGTRLTGAREGSILAGAFDRPAGSTQLPGTEH